MFRTFELEIDERYHEKTVKAVLKGHLGISENMITQLKKGDGIVVNGKKEFVNKLLSKGDLLKITLFEDGSEIFITYLSERIFL